MQKIHIQLTNSQSTVAIMLVAIGLLELGISSRFSTLWTYAFSPNKERINNPPHEGGILPPPSSAMLPTWHFMESSL